MKVPKPIWIKTPNGWAGRNGFIQELSKFHASGFKFGLYLYAVEGPETPLIKYANRVRELKAHFNGLLEDPVSGEAVEDEPQSL